MSKQWENKEKSSVYTINTAVWWGGGGVGDRLYASPTKRQKLLTLSQTETKVGNYVERPTYFAWKLTNVENASKYKSLLFSFQYKILLSTTTNYNQCFGTCTGLFLWTWFPVKTWAHQFFKKIYHIISLNLKWLGASLNPILDKPFLCHLIKFKTPAECNSDRCVRVGQRSMQYAIVRSFHTNLKTLDTIGNCQRPVFSLGVSQHMHK